MTKTVKRFIPQLALLATFCMWAASGAAQAPVPTTATPTLHGGTPVNGSAVLGEVGFAALRGSFYMGDSDSDFAIQLSAPTFGRDQLPGWGQSLGIDVRAPFRFLVSRWAKANGSFKVGPYLHAGRACFSGRGRGRYDGPYYRDYRRECGNRTVGVGAHFGYVVDIALPKIFKLIVGVEQQLGLLNFRNNDVDYSRNFFAGATWVDLGLEAFWKNMFFTMIINAGAQYGSDDLYYRDRALFRQMFGFGYKFR